jgi:hypothetical protein
MTSNKSHDVIATISSLLVSSPLPLLILFFQIHTEQSREERREERVEEFSVTERQEKHRRAGQGRGGRGV